MSQTRGSVRSPAEQAEVREMFFRQMENMQTESIVALRDAIKSGRFNGSRLDTCIYGFSAKGAGFDFTGLTRDEIAEKLREFGKSVGIEICVGHEPDILEKFVINSGSNGSSSGDHNISVVLRWCETILKHRKQHEPPKPTAEFVGTRAEKHEAFV